MFFNELVVQTEQVLELCRAQKLKLALAESCTGGLIASLLTSVPGSSDVLERGFVTYSNDAKEEMLGVSKENLNIYGAVSEQIAKEMAEGAIKYSHADLAISVTGIAGPDGGTDEKPVGLVCFGLAQNGKMPHTEHMVFEGTRTLVRMAAVEYAMTMLQYRLSSSA